MTVASRSRSTGTLRGRAGREPRIPESLCHAWWILTPHTHSDLSAGNRPRRRLNVDPFSALVDSGEFMSYETPLLITSGIQRGLAAASMSRSGLLAKARPMRYTTPPVSPPIRVVAPAVGRVQLLRPPLLPLRDHTDTRPPNARTITMPPDRRAPFSIALVRVCPNTQRRRPISTVPPRKIRSRRHQSARSTRSPLIVQPSYRPLGTALPSIWTLSRFWDVDRSSAMITVCVPAQLRKARSDFRSQVLQFMTPNQTK